MRDNKDSLIKEIYAGSPFFLGKDILGFTKFCETQIGWDEWARNIFQFNPQNRVFALMLAPRETFKSTFFVVTFSLLVLCQNPNLTILIIGETQTNAEAHLKEIKSKIESESFRAIFGNWVSPDLWRDDAITIKPRTHFTKEASIEAAGVGKSLTGKHYDVVIGDDLVGSEDRESPAKREKTFNFFNGVFDVLKKESGQGLFIGTRWHREDLYHHIITKIAPDLEKKDGTKFHVSVIPAHDKATGTLNYPRLLPESRLEELKTVKQGKDGIDISTFMAQYELDPMSPEEQIFKTFKLIDITTQKYEQFMVWTDPALGNSDTSCYAPSIVLAHAEGSAFWDCIYASVVRRNPSEIIIAHNRIYRMIRDLYHINGMAFMESNGFQLLLQQDTVSASADEQDPVPTIPRPSTKNKHARIQSMEPAISQGFIRFRDDWERAPEGYRLLLEQLQNFPQGKIDGPDALQCCWNEVQLSCGSLLYTSTMFDKELADKKSNEEKKAEQETVSLI